MPRKIISEELEKRIFQAKKSGLSDMEIGAKFGVGLIVIEKAITKISGINVNTPSKKRNDIKSWEPKNFKLEQNTVWSFKSRGNWASHSGNYRGNWSPYIPRNIILRYSVESEKVLDCFCGSGVTGVEAKLLNRNFIGRDINPQAIELSKENIDLIPKSQFGETNDTDIDVGDARDLSFLKNNSIDLICTHPPYADILKYTDNEEQDLSFLKIDDFLENMVKVAKENYRVLDEGRYCSILIGDMRKEKHVIPMGFRLIDVYLQNGFVLKELIIKRQHNCRTTGFWYKNSIKYNFLLLAHEYLAVFQKSKKSNETPSFPSKVTKIKKKKYEPENDKAETMTVWLTNPKKWYEHIIYNLISRYNGNNHKIIIEPKEIETEKRKKLELVIWDIRQTPDVYVNNANVIADKINDEGYLVILCEDVRLKDGTIYPSALLTEKEISKTQSLKIREIIMVSIENSSDIKKKNNDLEINHKYLLVYRKIS